ncbi:prolyl oligopeptidase family serine peptidase [Psychrosphaera sp. B3R10]|uniref:alpha/beta hydrolase family protein n=1 Tax=unclassified Psychrosphaera TaxID=2641570 RepID=UPI001C0841AB|nr:MULTISPECIES: prolyl oligopeptidase family serine peptidase [unclassified Psychrosphaera]MBU2881533.1 prolyl oligopeptidase family serine peptidase [Psychrosphaera sp. I2R16]MBU2988682.1 prolyl oligopeptidase family serine peptidase [Psychrosphaera sp. B3R10]
MKFSNLVKAAAVLLGLLSLSIKAQVPIETFFKGVSYANMRLSPNGKFLAAGKVLPSGEMHAFIINRKTNEMVSEMKFAGKLGVSSVTWLNDKRVIVGLGFASEMSEGFGGIGQLLGMDIDGSRKDILWSGQTSDYGGNEGMRLIGPLDAENYLISVYPSGSGMSKFPYTYIYKLNMYTGEATKLYRSPIRAASPIRKKDKETGEWEVTHWVGKAADSFSSTVVLTKKEDGSWEEIRYEENEGMRIPRGYSSDGKWLYVRDTISAPTSAVVKVNVKTGEETIIYRHPKVDVSQMFQDDNGDFWGALINYDYPKVVILDEDNYYAQVQLKMEAAFPNQAIQIASKTADSTEWLIHVSSDKHPGKYYIFNQFDGSLKFVVNRADWVDPKEMPTTHAIRFNARDGLEIGGYLTVPKGKNAKNLPLIILPHGGPHGPRDVWGWNSERNILANAGYAVLAVNYRGSGGFGRNFQYDWYGHWGLEMQDDLTDATYWAINSGIANVDRVCIYGASYGGYATLMGLVKEPDLYKCGIGYVGVYDLNVMMYTGDVAMRKAGKNYLNWALGDTEEKRRAQSPAPNAEKINSPVFLMHGMLDYRAHFENYVVMRDALLEQDHRFETLLIPRAGHGARDQSSRKQIFCRMLDFFDRHIGEKPDPMRAPSTDCDVEGVDPLPFEYFAGKGAYK